MDGVELSTMNESNLIKFRLENIGFVFQSYNLIPVLTAKENTEFIMLLKGAPEKERQERVIQLLHEVGIGEQADKRPSEMSGGQQQRVFLARALAQDAELYLLDEPFAGVDAATAKAIIDVLSQLRDAGQTVVAVHHDLATVQSYFDRVFLFNTRKVAEGPVSTAFTSETLQIAYGGRLATGQLDQLDLVVG